MPLQGSRPVIRPGLEEHANPLEGLRAISLAALEENAGLPINLVGAHATLSAAAMHIRKLLKDGLPALDLALSMVNELTQSHDLEFAEALASHRMLDRAKPGFMSQIRSTRAIANTFRFNRLNVRPCSFDTSTMARLRKLQFEALKGEHELLMQHLAALRFAAVGQSP